ncbi:MAG: ribonuclease HI family protein [Patescibacteria group bacterium]|nr:ribonuclease HI family protein [Patescibacteria group bacterium]MDE2144367.1 ribonuclease HI family protein [Patescibacteria group bacterium]
MGKLVIYTDGGSRGNPGKAAIGVVVGDKKYGERIGTATNNTAEYKAIVFALKKAKQLLGKEKCKQAELEMRMDSELAYSQLTGRYKLKEESLFPLFIEIWNLKQEFKKVEFTHVPREQNREADRLVNQALDEVII